MNNGNTKQFSKNDIIKAAMYGEVSFIDAQHIVKTLESMLISKPEQPDFCYNCVYSELLHDISLPTLHYCGRMIKQFYCKGKYREEWD